jgi:hypothetical protein
MPQVPPGLQAAAEEKLPTSPVDPLVANADQPFLVLEPPNLGHWTGVLDDIERTNFSNCSLQSLQEYS